MSGSSVPRYPIGVVASMLRIHPQTLRLYERKGLIRPSRAGGRARLYSEADLEDLRRILRLTRDLGVNLAGVEVILRMRRQMLAMKAELEGALTHVRPAASGEGASEGAALVRVADRHLRRLDVL